jgi:hypothetical protein
MGQREEASRLQRVLRNLFRGELKDLSKKPPSDFDNLFGE